MTTRKTLSKSIKVGDCFIKGSVMLLVKSAGKRNHIGDQDCIFIAFRDDRKIIREEDCNENLDVILDRGWVNIND